MKTRKFIIFFTLWLSVGVVSISFGQEHTTRIDLQVNSDDWQYKTSDSAFLDIKVYQGANIMKNVPFTFEAGKENMTPTMKGQGTTGDGGYRLVLGTLREPGFLRCAVTVELEGKIYTKLVTLGFGVDKIKPTVTLPKDFKKFWNKAIEEVRRIPLDAKMEKNEARSTDKVDVYEISFQNTVDSRMYGALAIPKKEGKFPVVLKVPGAGVRAYQGDRLLAEKGFIVLQLGIHGVPINQLEGFYKDLARNKLYEYYTFDHDDRDKFYFKRVFQGCVKAVDFIQQIPRYDGENLAVVGGSQGGALSVVTAALDARIKFLISYFPALSDVSGYLYGRTGGWPHTLKKPENQKEEIINTFRYYDAANFARFVKIPGFYSWGYNDKTCPATTSYALYNAVDAPKEKLIEKEAGHTYTKPQQKAMDEWLIKQMKK